MRWNVDEIAHNCARVIRGCATDEQYIETVERINAALVSARADALEDAAKWHEEQAELIRARDRQFRIPHPSDEEAAKRHERYAAAIRLLKDTGT